jgi:hypothetical protein
MGRMSCPSCGVRLAMKHRWFYWPAMVLSGIVLCVPLSLLAYRLTDSMVVTMLAATIGWILSGLPADKYLEANFAILKVAGKATISPDDAPPEPEEAAAEEPKEENV